MFLDAGLVLYRRTVRRSATQRNLRHHLPRSLLCLPSRFALSAAALPLARGRRWPAASSPNGSRFVPVSISPLAALNFLNPLDRSRQPFLGGSPPLHHYPQMFSRVCSSRCCGSGAGPCQDEPQLQTVFSSVFLHTSALIPLGALIPPRPNPPPLSRVSTKRSRQKSQIHYVKPTYTK